MENKEKTYINLGKEYIFVKRCQSFSIGEKIIKATEALYKYATEKKILMPFSTNEEKYEAVKLLFENEFTHFVEISKNNIGEFTKKLFLSDLLNELNNRFGLDLELVCEDREIKHKGKVEFKAKYLEKELLIKVSIDNKKLKSDTKRLGFKSALVNNDKIILTSAGKKDEVVKEKEIKDNSLIFSKKDPKSYDVKKDGINENNITLFNKYVDEAKIDNPLKRNNSSKKENINKSYYSDYLGQSKKIIENVFGKNKEFNDNIHIQIAYNVLDIKKIINLYFEEINYSFVSLDRTNNSNTIDLIGNIHSDVNYETFINDVSTKNKEETLNNFNEYFKNAKGNLINFAKLYSSDIFSKGEKESKNLTEEQKEKKEKEYQKNKIIKEEKLKKETYNIFRVLSLVRQFVTHGDYKQSGTSKYDSLLNIDGFKGKPEYQDVIDIVTKNYDSTYNKLNADFLKNNKLNMYIIYKHLNIDENSFEARHHLKQFYDMSIGKGIGNLGFDFKVVRQFVIEKSELNIEENDNTGIFSIINYLIYNEVKKNEIKEGNVINNKLIGKSISKLLAANTIEEKVNIYQEIATIIANSLKLNSKDISKFRNLKRKNKDGKHLKLNMNMNPVSSSLFDKFLFYLCNFLDMKSINMFLTSISNKFENIHGFINLLKEEGETVEFAEEYSIFNSNDNYVEKLTRVSSMIKPIKNYKSQFKNTNVKVSQQLYNDAYLMLGFADIYGDDKEKLHEIHQKIRDNEYFIEFKTPKLKNFIESHIINSRKFRYIIEYTNPKDCYMIIQNSKVVEYVLNDVPTSELNKYFEKTKITGEYTQKEKIKMLAEKLKSLNIKYLEEKYASENNYLVFLTGLYMTVIYLVIKNIVRINSFYRIAFSTYERDQTLFGTDMKNRNIDETDDSNKNSEKHDKVEDYALQLVKVQLENNRYKTRTRNYIMDNINTYYDLFTHNNLEKLKDYNILELIGYNSKIPGLNKLNEKLSKGLSVNYRNQVAHLSAVANIGLYINDYVNVEGKEMRSYFELYQYIIQRTFIDSFEKLDENGNEINFKTDFYLTQRKGVMDSHTYSKDLLHILNMPFAYNLARYKNLTIEDVFYDRYKTWRIK